MIITALLEGARSGRTRDLARLLTLVENDPDQARDVAQAIGDLSVQMVTTPIIGVTGPPGVGKSTTTTALINWYRAAGKRVAVLAVDPSSPFSGGALLGDRIRMQAHATDPGVFIRSMAARGQLGGMAAATPLALAVLQACTFDVVIVETVGVGQSEIDVARMADSTILVLAPGMGDGIQAAKAGIIEIADIFAVNKADREGADATVRELRAAIALGQWRGWQPPVITLTAIDGTGIPDLVASLEQHHAWLEASGQGVERRRARIRDHIRSIALNLLSARLPDVDPYVDQVMAGMTTAYSAAEAVISEPSGEGVRRIEG